MTKSPGVTVVTSALISSTTLMNSCPIETPSVVGAASGRGAGRCRTRRRGSRAPPHRWRPGSRSGTSMRGCRPRRRCGLLSWPPVHPPWPGRGSPARSGYCQCLHALGIPPTVGSWHRWTCARRSGSSCVPGAPGSPERLGCPPTGAAAGGGGLRREEVAMLAGVSVDYYVRMERGGSPGRRLRKCPRCPGDRPAPRGGRQDHTLRPCPGVRAGSSRRRSTAAPTVRPGIQQVLDAITDAPAWARNAGMTSSR